MVTHVDRSVVEEWIAAGPESDRPCLIDVRNSDEVNESGLIGYARHVPLQDIIQRRVFETLSEEEWESEYGFQKPTPETRLAFYCKAGVRSQMAAETFEAGGAKTTFNYVGSAAEWFRL